LRARSREAGRGKKPMVAKLSKLPAPLIERRSGLLGGGAVTPKAPPGRVTERVRIVVRAGRQAGGHRGVRGQHQRPTDNLLSNRKLV